jgi:hypothetical protein
MPLHRPLVLLSLASLLLCASLSAQSLKITSTPPGATVELDGVASGTTPFEKKFPGGYFRRTRTAIGERLEHPLVVRVSLPGNVTREIALTEGPMDWIDLRGRHHGQYGSSSPITSRLISRSLPTPSPEKSTPALLCSRPELPYCRWKNSSNAPSLPSSISRRSIEQVPASSSPTPASSPSTRT